MPEPADGLHDDATGPHGSHLLGHRTWPELGAEDPRTLLVPVGSCEQHGPHLPLATDALVAHALAERAARARPGTVVAPTLAYGASGEHAGFPGTLSIGTDVLAAVLVEIGRSALPPVGGAATGAGAPPAGDPAGAPDPAGAFASLVVVDGHGGNRAATSAAVSRLRDEGRAASAWWPAVADGDAHAGETETSLLLALHPDLVGPDRPVGATEPLAELWPALRDGGVASVSPTGVLGDARGASAARGRALLDALVADLVAHLDRVAPRS